MAMTLYSLQRKKKIKNTNGGRLEKSRQFKTHTDTITFILEVMMKQRNTQTDIMTCGRQGLSFTGTSKNETNYLDLMKNC